VEINGRREAREIQTAVFSTEDVVQDTTGAVLLRPSGCQATKALSFIKVKLWSCDVYISDLDSYQGLCRQELRV